MALPTVQARGEARLSALPDLATLRVTVRSDGRSAEAVSAQLADRSARLRSVLDDHAAAIETSSSSGIQIGPVLDRQDRVRPRGYRGSVTSTVVVHDFPALSDLILGCAAVEQTEISGPDWSLRPDNPMYRSARIAAIEDGRRRATDYAQAFGAELVALLEITDGDGGGLGGPRLMMGAMAGETELVLEPTEQDVVGRVTVRFSLTEPDLDQTPAALGSTPEPPADPFLTDPGTHPLVDLEADEPAASPRSPGEDEPPDDHQPAYG